MELRDQLTELRRAMKEAKERRMYERYQAVFLYLSGHKMEEVARFRSKCSYKSKGPGVISRALFGSVGFYKI